GAVPFRALSGSNIDSRSIFVSGSIGASAGIGGIVKVNGSTGGIGRTRNGAAAGVCASTHMNGSGGDAWGTCGATTTAGAVGGTFATGVTAMAGTALTGTATCGRARGAAS